jgi:hypothetical protein
MTTATASKSYKSLQRMIENYRFEPIDAYGVDLNEKFGIRLKKIADLLPEHDKEKGSFASRYFTKQSDGDDYSLIVQSGTWQRVHLMVSGDRHYTCLVEFDAAASRMTQVEMFNDFFDILIVELSKLGKE